MSRLAESFRAHPYLSTGLALALALTLVFAVRAAVFTVYWADPAHRAGPLEGWMTPGYVAHARGLSRDEMRVLLGPYAPGPGDRRTLAEIAAAEGVPLEDLLARIEAALPPRP
jgi:hypothetical protein